MAQSKRKNDVRFIRKGGRIIPIRSKSSGSKKKRAKKPIDLRGQYARDLDTGYKPRTKSQKILFGASVGVAALGIGIEQFGQRKRTGLKRKKLGRIGIGLAAAGTLASVFSIPKRISNGPK